MSIVCRLFQIVNALTEQTHAGRLKQRANRATNDGQIANAHRVRNTICIVHTNVQVFLSVCAMRISQNEFPLFSVPKNVCAMHIFRSGSKIYKTNGCNSTSSWLGLSHLSPSGRTTSKRKHVKFVNVLCRVFRSFNYATSESWNMQYMLFQWQTNFQAGLPVIKNASRCSAVFRFSKFLRSPSTCLDARTFNEYVESFQHFYFFHLSNYDRSRSVACAKLCNLNRIRDHRTRINYMNALSFYSMERYLHQSRKVAFMQVPGLEVSEIPTNFPRIFIY